MYRKFDKAVKAFQELEAYKVDPNHPRLLESPSKLFLEGGVRSNVNVVVLAAAYVYMERFIDLEYYNDEGVIEVAIPSMKNDEALEPLLVKLKSLLEKKGKEMHPSMRSYLMITLWRYLHILAVVTDTQLYRKSGEALYYELESQKPSEEKDEYSEEPDDDLVGDNFQIAKGDEKEYLRS